MGNTFEQAIYGTDNQSTLETYTEILKLIN